MEQASQTSGPSTVQQHASKDTQLVMTTEDKLGRHDLSQAKLIDHLQKSQALPLLQNLTITYLQVGRDVQVLLILLKACGAVTALLLIGNHINLADVNSFIQRVNSHQNTNIQT